MPDNPTPPQTPGFALPDHHILAITGPDAAAFLQAQTMNDVAALGDGDWQWNGWLTPKGRLVALFALLRRDATTFWLLLPDHPADTLAEALRRYVFRSKVKIEVRDDLQVAGRLAADANAAADAGARRFGMEAGGTLSLAWPGGRHIDIGAADAPDGGAQARLAWRQQDLATGIPRLVADQSAQWTPQQLSLERLQAYSVKKGCYPGQEIVARTHFLGQAKRGLVLLEAAGMPTVGAEIRDAERAIGQIIAVAGALALGVVSAGTPHLAGEVPVSPLDFAG